MRSGRLLASILGVAVSLFAAPSAAIAAPSQFASIPDDTRQAIIVTAPNWHSSHADLTAFERNANGSWRRVLGPVHARIGETGMIPAVKRFQDTGKTPAGIFAIPSAFGRMTNPGTALPYLHLDRNDTWPYWRGDPATYNVLQTAPFDAGAYGKFIERLWSKGNQYDYVAVMDYNLPTGDVSVGADGVRRTSSPANTRKGGGIFLHVTNGRSTAGCIAIAEQSMVQVLRWLDPATQPVIVTRVA